MSLPQDGKYYRPHIKSDHDNAVDPFDRFFAYCKNVSDNADGYQDYQIIKGCGIYPNGMNDRRYAQNEKDVKNIGANDIAHGKPRFPFSGGNYRCDQFGKRGSDGDDSEADQGFRHSDSSCDLLCTVDNALSAAYDKKKPYGDKNETFPERHAYCGLFFLQILPGMMN